VGVDVVVWEDCTCVFLCVCVCMCVREREREREGTSHCCRGEAWRGNYGESQRSREKKR